MKIRIAKWGNSLALRLPKAVTSSHLLREGTEVELTEIPEGLLIRPATASYDLDELLKGVSTSNRHSAIGTGEQTGKEAW